MRLLRTAPLRPKIDALDGGRSVVDKRLAGLVALGLVLATSGCGKKPADPREHAEALERSLAV